LVPDSSYSVQPFKLVAETLTEAVPLHPVPHHTSASVSSPPGLPPDPAVFDPRTSCVHVEQLPATVALPPVLSG